VPITDLQVRMREIGRIRTGIQVEGRGGKRRPAKLETFRITATRRELLEEVAGVYGGTVEPWPEHGFQLTTTADQLDVIIPPGQAISQWYELWGGGGCLRRCDGVTADVIEEIRGRRTDDQGPRTETVRRACLCPKDGVERRELAAKGEACKPTTRLSVILPLVPDLGVWRLESHGFYAAVELGPSVDLLAAASQRGIFVDARLRLEQREQKRPGQPTKRYAVPVLELPKARVADVLGAIAERGGAGGEAALPAGIAPAARMLAAPGQRPELGPAPALPATTAMRVADPEPEAEAPAPRNVTPADAAEGVIESSPAAPPLTSDELGAKVRAYNDALAEGDRVLSRGVLDRVAERLFPHYANRQLTNEERGRLWEAVLIELKTPVEG
jgi:hypothetical protein